MPAQHQTKEELSETHKRVTFLEPEHTHNETSTTTTTITMSPPKDPEIGSTVPATKNKTTGNYTTTNNVNLNPTSSYFDAVDAGELEDDRPWVSWLVPAIVVINIAVFIAVMYVNNCPTHVSGGGGGGRCVVRFLGRFSFQSVNENPLFGPSSHTLAKMGSLDWSKIVHNHQFWRLITSIWLHAGIIHLLANMLSLVFVGLRLEQQFGFVRVGVIYLVSGIGGGILSSLFIQKNISVGASGALFGLLGAMLAELITNWTIYSNKVAALLTLLFIISINLALGILPHVDNFAHIGGFITGLLLGFVLLLRPHIGWLTRRDLHSSGRVWSKYRVYQIVLWVVSILLLLIWFTVGMVMLGRGENGYDHCHWCRYLSCVPTSKWQCNN